MATKDSTKPYKGRPKRNKKPPKSVHMDMDVTLDNETNVESIATTSTEVVNDVPSRQEFQQLSKTVNELTDLIKSLKNDKSLNDSNKNLQNVTDVVPSVNNITLDENTNAGSMATNTQVVDHEIDVSRNDSSRLDIRDLASGTQNQNDNSALQFNQINDSIATHLSTLMGDEEAFPKPGNYTPTDQPVDMKVSEKIRNMIWSNQYIDLGVLLDPTLEHNKPKFEFVGQSGESVTIAPKKPARLINGLGQWCSAFTVFINIYCQKYPNELPMLFTYMNTIKKLSHRNGLYLTYDEEFRYMRQSQPLPWNITHSGLWLECRDNPNHSKNQKGGKNRNQNGFRTNSFENVE